MDAVSDVGMLFCVALRQLLVDYGAAFQRANAVDQDDV
jgi:hypothetical protein